MNTLINNKNGKHLLAEFYDCQCAIELLCHSDAVLDKLIEAVQTVGLTLVGQAVHDFSDTSFSDASCANAGFTDTKLTNTSSNKINADKQSSGYTISLLLAESHICIHTWAELKSVTLDVYVCNFLQDNSDKANNLLKMCKNLFLPAECDIKEVWREHAR